MRIVAIPSGEELKKEFYEGEKEFDADCVFDRVVFVVPNPTKTQQYFFKVIRLRFLRALHTLLTNNQQAEGILMHTPCTHTS